MDVCRICGNTESNARFTAREMMFGTREEFEYFSCPRCGCLQIVDIPGDMSRHYPKDYYSYSPRLPRTRFSGLRRYLKLQRLKVILGERDSWFGRLLASRWPASQRLAEWFKPVGVRAGDAILEVGCGQGGLLLDLADEGFRALTGVDPYMDKDLEYPHGVRVFKRRLDEVDGRFDFAMIHHAFEHLPDPLQALKDFRRLLATGRHVLIRIPVADAAWEEYGVDWVQLDAPRHFFLHTERSMGILAGKAGFRIQLVTYDSSEFQFMGSEQYRMGIPLRDPRSYKVNPSKSAFAPEQVAAYRKRAADWNRERKGDSACFFLQAQ